MGLQTKNREPLQLTAGDTIDFRRSLGDYPAPDWAISYSVAGPNGAYQFASTPAGADHAVLVASAVTALWAPGDYTLVGEAVKAVTGERAEVYRATNFPIAPNPQFAVAGDQNRTFNQRMVEKLEAVLEGRAGDDVMKSTILGVVIERMSPTELFALYQRFKLARDSEVDGERALAGLPNRRKVKAKFMVMMEATSPGVTGFVGAGHQP